MAFVEILLDELLIEVGERLVDLGFLVSMA